MLDMQGITTLFISTLMGFAIALPILQVFYRFQDKRFK